LKYCPLVNYLVRPTTVYPCVPAASLAFIHTSVFHILLFAFEMIHSEGFQKMLKMTT
jgi:hypothetical protein